MAAAQLIAWGLLLATGVPTRARWTLPAGLSPGGTLQRGRAPQHSPSWEQQWLGLSPPWEASGEPSGAGAAGNEHGGNSSPVHWSPVLQVRDAMGPPLEMETTMAGGGMGARRDGSTAQAMAEQPFISWQGHKAEGQDSLEGGTWLPHGSALGTLGPEVPTDMGLGSPGLPWAGQGLSPDGQSATGPPSTPGPQPTTSTITLIPMLAAGTGMGTAVDHTGGLPQGAPASSQPVPRGTVPVSPGTDMRPAQGPHASPGSTQLVSRQGDLGWGGNPHSALPSSAPQLPPTAPSWGLAEPWTRVFPVHQRSTRRAPLGHATASPRDAAPHTEPGLMERRGPQPTPGTDLNTSPALLPASSMAPPGTPGTGRSQCGMGDPSVGTEPLWVPAPASALSRRAAARGGRWLSAAGPGCCGPRECSECHQGCPMGDSASCHRDTWDQALR